MCIQFNQYDAPNVHNCFALMLRKHMQLSTHPQQRKMFYFHLHSTHKLTFLRPALCLDDLKNVEDCWFREPTLMTSASFV